MPRTICWNAEKNKRASCPFRVSAPNSQRAFVSASQRLARASCEQSFGPNMAPVATPCRAPLAALQAPIWQCIHASAERRKEELEAEAAAAALKRSKRKSERASRSLPKRRRKAKSGRDRQTGEEMGSQLAAKTGSQLLAALPAVAEDLDKACPACGYSWCRCWQQALTLWEGFEQQEVEDIFTVSEAEPCAARSSSAGWAQNEVQPKQGEARPTADEKVGKGSRRANPKPRTKTRGKKSAEPAPPAGPQRPEDQPAQPAEAPREDLEGKPQRVFHIVFSHPREDVPGRKNPKDLTRQEFADKLDSVFQDATRDSAAQILRLSVFQEHENEEPRMHAAMQVLEPIRHTRLFRTLREKHGIFIHLEDGRRTLLGHCGVLGGAVREQAGRRRQPVA